MHKCIAVMIKCLLLLVLLLTHVLKPYLGIIPTIIAHTVLILH
jgi:hypothetical protein